MRVLTSIFVVVAFLAGLGALGYAFIYPSNYTSALANASAVQITQVYTQAMYYALLGIGALLAAGIGGLSLVAEAIGDLRQETSGQAEATRRAMGTTAPNTGAPQSMGGKLGSL